MLAKYMPMVYRISKCCASLHLLLTAVFLLSVLVCVCMRVCVCVRVLVLRTIVVAA